MGRVTNDNRSTKPWVEEKVFNSEASNQHKDMELSSISLFKAHGIIYIYNKIIVNRKSKKNP